VLQTETGSVSGPLLFTSCKMVYIYKNLCNITNVFTVTFWSCILAN